MSDIDSNSFFLASPQEIYCQNKASSASTDSIQNNKSGIQSIATKKKRTRHNILCTKKYPAIHLHPRSKPFEELLDYKENPLYYPIKNDCFESIHTGQFVAPSSFPVLLTSSLDLQVNMKTPDQLSITKSNSI